MTGDRFDLVVIGAGAAGLAAARTAARARARVALVSDGPPGGECTFTGCVPSKTLIEAAARGGGFTAAMAAVRAAIARIAATETATVLEAEGVTVVTGRASFVRPGEVAVAGRRLRAPRFVIAAGARPSWPVIPGLADVKTLTTEDVFDLNEAPGSVAVLGGGPVGCELAQAFARLGVRVTVVEAAGRLLPAADPAASAVIADAFAADGIAVHAGVAARAAETAGSGVRLRLADGTEVRADRLLLAAGRAPDLDALDLEAAGVRTGDGHIATDDRLATTARGVYAAGDVTGQMPFTHAADAMGRLAAGNALRKRGHRRFSTAAIPWVVFTDPEVAQVGVLESDATGARVAYLPMAEVDRAVTAGRERGFVKLITGPRRVLGTTGGGRLLGATIVAARAGEMIHEPALAMRTGMFTGRLAQTTHAYPTWSAAIQQAAAQFFGPYGGRTARTARADQRTAARR